MTADPIQATPCDLDCQFNPHLNGVLWHCLLAYRFHGYQRTETYVIYIYMNNKELFQANYVIQ